MSIFKTIKAPLKNLLKNGEIIQPKIEEFVNRVNKFAIRNNEFIKLYILYIFERNAEIPKINASFIRNIYNLIGKRDNRGKSCKIDVNMSEFYNAVFSKIYPDKLDKINLPRALLFLTEEIIRCLETNIKTNFMKYISKCVNAYIKDPEIIGIKHNIPRCEHKDLFKEVNTKAKNVKEDIFNMRIEKSNEEYHSWIKEIIQYMPEIKKSMAYDIKVNPQSYIGAAIILNKKIEACGKKPYQIFPQRNSFVPKNITLDTNGILELINDKKKNIFNFGYSEMRKNIKTYQDYTWQNILHLDKKLFKQKNYKFYNQIQTDGISISILFIREEFYDKKFGQRLPKEVEEEYALLNKLSEEECKEFSTKTLIGIDPGKNKLITAYSENDTFYTYSNDRRREESYFNRSKKILLKEKRKNASIIDIETDMSKFSKTTLNIEKYIEGVNFRKDKTPALEAFYKKPIFRKLSLRRYIKTKQSEEKMLNEIKEKFGSNVLLGLGDWSKNCSTQLKGCNPSVNRGIGRILRRKFDVVYVDEFRTSKLYNKNTKEELINLKLKIKNRTTKIHTLLTLKSNPNGIIMNRDKNAAKNILSIVKNYISDRERPVAFCRKK